MCQPDIPDMPEYEEPKVAPPAPTPVQPDDVAALPPPISTSAKDDDVKLKKRLTARQELQRSKGLNRFRIPLNTNKTVAKNSLNIPK